MSLEEIKNISESRDLYKIIFENSAVAIMLTDAEERVVAWNRYTEHLLGYTHEDLYLKEVSTLYPPEEWRRIRAEDIRRKGMQHHFETKMIRSDGSLLDVDISISVLRDHEGRIIGSIGVIKDISEQKKAEEKIKYEHSLLQSLLDNIPDSIYFKDTENRFILVNKAKASHSNVTPEEMIGKTDFDFLPEDEAKKTYEDDIKVMETGKPIIDKIEKITRKDGSERWVSVTKIPRYNEKGEVIGTMGISRDITKRIKGEKETEKYKKVAIGQNLRMIELRDKVKELLKELEDQ